MKRKNRTLRDIARDLEAARQRALLPTEPIHLTEDDDAEDEEA